MNVIIDLWREQLHEISILTERGRKLRLYIDKDPSGYRLTGEFFEIDDRVWYAVAFSSQRVPDPKVLLEGCLRDLDRAMKSKSDSIKHLHNTCNAPLVSAQDQKDILVATGIDAEVQVN